MPLASVKKRSKRPVMSFSICSGGIPEKNVATTTTGILIGGNRSTGIRTRAGGPTTESNRREKTIKYGLRMEKPAILFGSCDFRGRENLRLYPVAWLETAPAANQHQLLIR